MWKHLLIVDRSNINGTIVVVLGEVRHFAIERHTKIVATLIALAAQFGRHFDVPRPIGWQKVTRLSYKIRSECGVREMT